MKTFKQFLCMAIAAMLIGACGGGGDSLERTDSGNVTPDPTPTPTPMVTYTIAMQIADASGSSSNELSESTPLTITADVTDQNNAPAADVLITFTINQLGIAVFSNDTGTALTNADGRAQIGLVVADMSGDGLVTASVENGPSKEIGFRSKGIQQQQNTPTDLRLYASSTQIASSGTDDVELIAEAKNAQNILLSGVPVSFSADNGASLEIIDLVTRADGTARALLKTTNNKENRQINVAVNSGSLSDGFPVSVVGTEVNISGASSVIINDESPYTIVVADSNGTGIPNQKVIVSSSIGEIVDAQVTTGPTGQVTVNFKSAQAGKAEITATALNFSGKALVTVQQDDFGFIGLPEKEVELETAQTLNIKWFKNGTAFVGGLVSITSSRGQIAQANAVTDANGIATFSITSSFAGPSSITAIGFESESDRQSDNGAVSARASIEFIATTVDSIFVDASPDLIGPEGQESTISAVLRDEKGNLVKSKVVNFSLLDSSGGNIEPNSATTDSNGIASTTYTSNAVSIEDGVTIIATSGGVQASTDLTVGDRAFDISLGTGNTIQSPDTSSYLKEFSVFVSDSVGRPVAGIDLTASATAVKFVKGGTYRQGFWSYNQDDSVWENQVTVTCLNEDVNANGRLDQTFNADGSIATTEDDNRDEELTPGIVGTISFKNGVAQTNASGQATLELRYPKQFAPWMDVEIAVFGQSSGSEASDSLTFTLSLASDDARDQGNPPPANPFGINNQCNQL